MQLESVLKSLNLLEKDGLFFYADLADTSKSSIFNNRIKESLNKIKPDAFFCINEEPLLLFFYTYSDIEALEKQVWNFNQSPAIFIYHSGSWIIKNGFKYLNDKQCLDTLSNNISDFDYFEIITGQTWSKYKNKLESKNRVDHFLLQNIETARNILISNGLNTKIVNSLIGRVIFVRYLIDRQVKLNKYGILKTNDFYSILANQTTAYDFFKQIRTDFNGNLFPLKYRINDIEIQESDYVTNNHLSFIISLLKGDELISSNITQLSLFDIYDFSIIPIEFISNVYEKFIGVENQAKQGAYYTPLFLVDYIQKETVSKYFKNNPSEYNCKIYDPACGSGIFLVETLRYIISQYKKINPDYNLNKVNYEEYKEKLKELLTNNIFGTDKDDNAISVAIFSLYITLLDNLEPKSIVGFRFPILLGTNFFAEDFFNTNAIFNRELKKHNFNYILGNPPWATKHPREKQKFETYIEKRKIEENSNLEIIHREIAEAFLVRVSDFNFIETAFIVVSKILYKLEKEGKFRNYFLNKFIVRQVFELSSVRHQVFDKSNDKAVAPASILFYSKANNIDAVNSNIINHISLKPNIFFENFKLMVIEKYDCKQISQKHFVEEDWIWKVFVYGNFLDYYFIKRLRTKFANIHDVTSNINAFVKGQGLKFNDGKRAINTNNYIDYKFIGSLEKTVNSKGQLVDALTNYKKYVRPYYVNPNLKNWDGRFVGYFPENAKIFDAPSLLITGGITKDFKSVSAISYSNALFKSSLTAIKTLNADGLDVLKSIQAILNSTFFSYFIIQNGSSTGVEREETHDEEKWKTPYISDSKLISLVNQVESAVLNQHLGDLKDDYQIKQIEDIEFKIEQHLYSLFQLSEQEKSLIDYSKTITIPLLKGDSTQKKKVIAKLPYKANLLKNYSQIFINHFGKRFSSNRYFEVEILYSNHTILIKFKILLTPSKEQDSIVWKQTGDLELLKTISILSFENVSDNLYLQKDIKGFEPDFFYIAKPNQYKSWHPALAYLDLSEFIEALHNQKMK